MKTTRQKLLSQTMAVGAAALALAVPTLAQQQEPARNKEAVGLEEVLVVATRREASLQGVPMSVTAIDTHTLQREQIYALKDIGSLVPNLLMVTGTAGGAKSHFVASIRGQSQQERGGLADPSVMVYFGDVAIARTQGLNQSLVDIQAVEVVRGPTGTLFGRNSTGGAIVIRPNLPNVEEVGGSVGATVAKYGTRNFDGYVNVPLGDRAAIRLVGSSNKNDGFVKDINLGRNVNDDDNSSLRASLLLKPTDQLENVTMVNYYDENSGGPGGSVSALNPAGLIATIGAFRNYPPADQIISEQRARGLHKIANGVPELTDIETLDIHNTTTFHLNDNVTIKNIFGYRDMDGHVRVSLDGMEIPVLDTEIFDESEQWSNELQVFGETDKLQWIAGVYYFNEDGDNNAFSRAFAAETDLIEPLSLVNVTGAINNHQKFDNTSYAVFAEFTVDLDSMMDGLSLTVGGRQTWDEREALILNRNVNTSCRFTIDDDNDPSTPEINPGAGPDCRLDLGKDFDDFTYNVALQYQLDDSTMVYGSVRRGYRAGGFPARADQEVGLRIPVEPEYVTTWEIGGKRDWALGTDAFLRTNLTFYFSDYEDVQRQLVDTTSDNPFTVVVNAAKAEVKGLEAEFLLQATPKFQMSGFWGYIDTKFKNFIDPFTGADLSDSFFARVPENNWRLSAAYNFLSREDIGDVTLRAAWWGRDSFVASDNVEDVEAETIPSHDQLDLYLEIERLGGTNLNATLFVRNVNDDIELQPLAGVWGSLGFAAVISGMGRQYGAQLRYNF